MKQIKLKKRISIFIVPAKNSWWVLKISRNLKQAGTDKGLQQTKANNIQLNQ